VQKIAERFGFINTVVFTHPTTNLMCILVSFTPTLKPAMPPRFVHGAAVVDGRSSARIVCDGCGIAPPGSRHLQIHQCAAQLGSGLESDARELYACSIGL